MRCHALVVGASLSLDGVPPVLRLKSVLMRFNAARTEGRPSQAEQPCPIQSMASSTRELLLYGGQPVVKRHLAISRAFLHKL